MRVEAVMSEAGMDEIESSESQLLLGFLKFYQTSNFKVITTLLMWGKQSDIQYV